MNQLPPKYPSVSLTFFLSKTLFFIFFKQNNAIFFHFSIY
ncbi:hypothetical protein HMPREF1370_01404 [Enterococcus faecium P1123]|uniref:Uncharacterized protein n=1 Tax=Enterococcus faecium SD2A-2 TaxID=1244154 RepID=A0AB73A9Z0_ENTFC|nr:hypothetical protein EfmU0317_0560 [Enterococcus faecium U0317]EFR74973.1 hypothetical protein HMPREF9523_01107 [Enterococcus faecium TX0133A]EFR77344.1 hypothetical protein HMPREF9527_01838 [Enterococcus faecium TX0133C]EFS06662.1 hypothetical protein HMPREF9525_01227 [Enterococcus faecium TX0133a04]EFS10540.1 hypothetical protein HMPREF9522_00129 [Enterococcus faecium TX0082]EJX44188.1 hypothetical protein HMPREF1382_00821 [Enterococcus faecium S447]EJX45699.1 hypothetical protein HMPREF